MIVVKILVSAIVTLVMFTLGLWVFAALPTFGLSYLTEIELGIVTYTKGIVGIVLVSMLIGGPAFIMAIGETHQTLWEKS